MVHAENIHDLRAPGMASLTAELNSYLRLTAHSLNGGTPDPEVVLAHAAGEVMPVRLRDAAGSLSVADVRKACADTDRNRRTYTSFCLTLVERFLKPDGWTVSGIDARRIEPDLFGFSIPADTEDPHPEPAVAVFASADRGRRLFFFFSDQHPATLSAAAAGIAARDQDRFAEIAVLMTRSTQEMQVRREVSKAAAWKRGMFMAFDQLREHCNLAFPRDAERLCAPFPRPDSATGAATAAGIAAFSARILDHHTVGGRNSPYRKLRFQAPDLTGISPPQFIMTATRPGAPAGGGREVSWDEFKTSFPHAPRSYLKRPFGIHRAYYNGFPADYLNRLCLPRGVATIMHTVMPDTFEVFYKIPPNGKGTREMQELKPEMRIDMLGPLGQPFNVRRLVDGGVSEVHVIGGGVGMAPLVYLVQSLRFCSVPVKAFIGIESLDHLRYRLRHGRQDIQDEQLDQIHAAGGKDIHIYVDDLLQTGVERDNLHVSYDKPGDLRGIVPPGNHMQGVISDLYGRHLKSHAPGKRVTVFACGPTPMMQAVHEMTQSKEGMKTYVLMEKRMACGIGVCLSCVCRTRTGTGGYSRVCKEGPVFDADEILWHE